MVLAGGLQNIVDLIDCRSVTHSDAYFHSVGFLDLVDSSCHSLSSTSSLDVNMDDYSCFEEFRGGCAKVAPVVIDTGRHSPVSTNTPMFTPQDEEIFKGFLDDMLRKGMVKKCDFSPWSSKLLPVPKFDSDGNFKAWRPTLNLIPLNKCCEKDSYFPPHIGYLQFRFQGLAHYSSIDFTSVHNQLPLSL